MRIFKTRLFAKWMNKEKIADEVLRHAIYEMEQGLVDANLGGHVYKKRIALQGRGKRGGARTVLIYQAKAFAREVLQYSETQLNQLVRLGKLIEVPYDGKNIS